MSDYSWDDEVVDQVYEFVHEILSLLYVDWAMISWQDFNEFDLGAAMVDLMLRDMSEHERP